MSSVPLHIASPRNPNVQRSAVPLGRAHGIHASAVPAMLYSGPLGPPESALQFHSFDAGYIERLCAGDSQTQEHFVAYFTRLLQVKLRWRLHSPHAIEDVRQETFARVFAVLSKDGGLRQPERLGPFVNTVCNHVLLEHYRSSGRSESLDSEGSPTPASRDANALDIVTTRQIKDKVREILLDLPARDRALLKAVFLDERDRDEVCGEFGVDRDYLRVLLHRAKQEFKTEYMKRVGNRVPLKANAGKV